MLKVISFVVFGVIVGLLVCYVANNLRRICPSNNALFSVFCMAYSAVMCVSGFLLVVNPILEKIKKDALAAS